MVKYSFRHTHGWIVKVLWEEIIQSSNDILLLKQMAIDGNDKLQVVIINMQDRRERMLNLYDFFTPKD
jgi:hypothetical protein